MLDQTELCNATHNHQYAEYRVARSRQHADESGGNHALAAVGGSSVGAMAPVLIAHIAQRGQIQRDVLNRHIAQRETLHSDFITQASRLYADSIGHSLGKLDDVVALYALADRIRLLASPMVFRAAD